MPQSSEIWGYTLMVHFLVVGRGFFKLHLIVIRKQRETPNVSCLQYCIDCIHDVVCRSLE